MLDARTRRVDESRGVIADQYPGISTYLYVVDESTGAMIELWRDETDFMDFGIIGAIGRRCNTAPSSSCVYLKLQARHRWYMRYVLRQATLQNRQRASIS